MPLALGRNKIATGILLMQATTECTVAVKRLCFWIGPGALGDPFRSLEPFYLLCEAHCHPRVVSYSLKPYSNLPNIPVTILLPTLQ